MAGMSAEADRHRDVAGTFTRLVEGVHDWSAPAPVEGWTARDVVEHLVTWPRGLLSGGAGIDLPAVPEDDPAAAWRAHADGVQALLDDEDASASLLTNPYLGTAPVGPTLDRIYTTDVFLHAWDLAKASGQELRLEPQACEDLLAGMEPMDELLRSSGQYGPRVAVRQDADAQDRLMAFIGRDPDWTRDTP